MLCLTVGRRERPKAELSFRDEAVNDRKATLGRPQRKRQKRIAAAG